MASSPRPIKDEMTARLIDGKALAQHMRAEQKERVAALKARIGVTPGPRRGLGRAAQGAIKV